MASPWTVGRADSISATAASYYCCPSCWPLVLIWFVAVVSRRPRSAVRTRLRLIPGPAPTVMAAAHTGRGEESTFWRWIQSRRVCTGRRSLPSRRQRRGFKSKIEGAASARVRKLFILGKLSVSVFAFCALGPNTKSTVSSLRPSIQLVDYSATVKSLASWRQDCICCKISQMNLSQSELACDTWDDGIDLWDVGTISARRFDFVAVFIVIVCWHHNTLNFQLPTASQLTACPVRWSQAALIPRRSLVVGGRSALSPIQGVFPC